MFRVSRVDDPEALRVIHGGQRGHQFQVASVAARAL